MAAHKTYIAPELIAEGKRLYETTLTPRCDIAAALGISLGTLAARIKEWQWAARRPHRPSVDIFRAVRGAVAAVATDGSRPRGATELSPVTEQQRAALAARIQEVVESQLATAAQILAAVKAENPNEAEQSARTLASISRTVREIAALNQPIEVTPTHEADDDPVPRDIDEFRFELASRIRGFIEARRTGGARISAEPEAPLE